MKRNDTCHCCGSPVAWPPVRRGALAVAIASAGSNVVVAREAIQQLKAKRWSKQFMEQRQKDLEALAILEHQLATSEGTWFGLRFLQNELFGGP